MLKQWIQILALTLVLGCFAGCASSPQMVVRQPPTPAFPQGELVMIERAPAPLREYTNNAKDQEHVWVAGYWACSSGAWIWVPEHWELPPRDGAVWVPGTWEESPATSSRVWTEGHWDWD